MTGFESVVFAVVPVEPFELVELVELPFVFSGDLAGVAAGRGRFLGGLLVELDESTAGASSVRVKVPPDQTGNPIVFDIRIQHN